MSRRGIGRYPQDVWIEKSVLNYEDEGETFTSYTIVVDSEQCSMIDYDQLIEIRDIINRIERREQKARKNLNSSV